ncbi:MAG: transcription antitermination factor NusB [Candidatus Saccharibacteria bacterium]|jgi:N utilization substance protein B
MSSNRHLARVIALQTLYEYEFRTRSGIEGLTADLDEILERNLAVYKDTMEDDSFTRDLVQGAHKHQAEADALITPAAPEWPLEQIAKMDLAILRLAIYELHIKREVPPKVVINEAVELAKSFGGDNSSRFINGVLGTIYRQSEFYDPTEDHKVQREQSASTGQKAKTPAQRKAPVAPPQVDSVDSVDDHESDPDSHSSDN